MSARTLAHLLLAPQNSKGTHSLFSRLPVAALLISFFINATHGLAAETEASGNGGFEIITNLPYEGSIDRYHRVVGDGSKSPDEMAAKKTALVDPISNSLYVLRNAEVRDLLQTRLAIKFFFGSSQNAITYGHRFGLIRDAHEASKFAFPAPSSVVDLYETGLANRTETEDQDSPLYRYGQRAKPIKVKDVQYSASPVSHWIHALEESAPIEGLNSNTLLRNLTLKLIQQAAIATVYEKEAEFLEKDYWEDPAISADFQARYVKPDQDRFCDEMRRNSFGEGRVICPGSEMFFEPAKKKWVESSGTGELYQIARSSHEMIIEQFHLLSVPIDRLPSNPETKFADSSLASSIYFALEQTPSLGFPHRKMTYSSMEGHIPTDGKAPAIPGHFRNTIQGVLDSIASDPQKQKQAIDAVMPWVELALAKTLQQNTDRLLQLTEQIHYTAATEDNALLGLATSDKLWEIARSEYQYLEGYIDFNYAHTKIGEILAKNRDTRKTRSRVAIGAGIGLGVIGTIATFGSGAILGVGASTWFVSSSLVMVASSSNDYWAFSRPIANHEKAEFLGSTESGNHQQMKEALEMAESDFEQFLFSAVSLGLDIPFLKTISLSFRSVKTASGFVLRTTKTRYLSLLESTKALRNRLEVGSHLATQIRILETMLTKSIKLLEVPVSFSEALVKLRQRFPNMTTVEMLTKIESAPVIGSLFKKFGARFKADPSAWQEFLNTAAREVEAGLVIGIYSQTKARGEDLNHQLDAAAADLASSALLNIVLSGITVSSRNWAARGLSLGERAGAFSARMPALFTTGVMVNFTTHATKNMIEYYRNPNNPNGPHSLADVFMDSAKWGAFGGVFMALSSNTRYGFIKKLEQEVLEPTIGSGNNLNVIMKRARAANNFFAGWSWVKLATIGGVVNESGVAIPIDQYNFANDPEGSQIQDYEFNEPKTVLVRHKVDSKEIPLLQLAQPSIKE